MPILEQDYEKTQRRARRLEVKRQRLGSPAPRCLICGCLEIEVLTTVPVSALSAWILEDHHIAKRTGGDFTEIVCLNCHAIFTDWQEDWEPRLRDPKTPQERLAARLQGEVDLKLLQAKNLNESAADLQQWVRWLLGSMEGPAPP